MKSAALFKFAFSAFIIASVTTGHAQSLQLTNNMPCQQAINDYASDGRVYTELRNGAVLPRYGGVPAERGRNITCGRDRVRNAVMVISSDNPRCVIAYRCS